MTKAFTTLLIAISFFTLIFSGCGLNSLYSKEEFMNLGKNNDPSTTVNVNGTRSATIIIASSDSQAASQKGADLVILTTEDAGIKINEQIALLNSSTGGTVQLMEGTYNVSTNILPLSNVNITGSGTGTILKRSSDSLVQVIYIASSVSNVIFKNFSIDGNGLNYSIQGNGYGINCQINTNIGICYNNIQCNNNNAYSSYGFYNCTNLTNCAGSNNTYTNYNNGEGTSCGFCKCSYLTQCESKNNEGISGCDGFLNCAYLTQCKGNNNTGYGGCPSYGFTDCTYLSQCIGNNNNGDANSSGFLGCTYLSQCAGSNNSGYGFRSCTRMQQNTGSGNSSSLFNSSCYADDGSNPVAMTVAGGFNG
jgi:hypothetical protein